jgi:hypothetical protein
MPTILPHILVSFLLIYWSQLTRYFSELLYAQALERNPNHLLVRLAQTFDFSELEKACTPFHHQCGAGRPEKYPAGLLVRALLAGYVYDLSLRELEQRLYSDLILRWFVGLDMTGETPDHSTLERFHQWVMHNQPDLFFTVVLQQMEQHFPHERQREQIGDTYAMRANAADEGIVRRLRHLSEKLVVDLLRTLPAETGNCLRGFAWEKLFGFYPEKLNYFLDEKQRRERREQTALGAYELHQRVASLLSRYPDQKYQQARRWLGFLLKVLQDEFAFQACENGDLTAAELPNKDKGDFRLISATDPEATLRKHGDTQEDLTLGYNIQVAATTSGMIYETRAYTGAAPDQSGVVKLVTAQMERQGSCPPKLIYDKAGGSGKIRGELQQASDGQCSISARLPEYEQRSDRFGPYDFSLSQDRSALTCPNGKVSSIAYPAPLAAGRIFRFFAHQCWNGDPPGRSQASLDAALPRRCPLWELCRDPRQGSRSMRQVFISDYRELVLDTRLYNLTPDFEQDMKLRPRIERVIFELTHYNGARRCRRTGLAAADFQAKMCAVAYNLKLWMRRLCQNATPAR